LESCKINHNGGHISTAAVHIVD